MAQVSISGGVSQQIAVEVDATRASGLGLSNSYISQILAAENLLYPGGEMDNGSQTLTVTTDAKLNSVDEVANVIIPLPTGETSFTLANIACVLSGLLLGPVGGLASGLGSALYDLTNPVFAPECWLTFLTKGAMGLGAGLVAGNAQRRERLGYPRCLAAALTGCLVYYALYFGKSLLYDNMLVGGLPFAAAAALLPLKIPASLFNGAAAVAAAPPLYLAIRSAMKRAHLPLA